MMNHIKHISSISLLVTMLMVEPLTGADSLPRLRLAPTSTVEEVSSVAPQTQDFTSVSNVPPTSAEADSFSIVQEIVIQRVTAKDYPSVASFIFGAIQAGDMKAADAMMDAVFVAGDVGAAERVLSMVIQSLVYDKAASVNTNSNMASVANAVESMSKVEVKADSVVPAKTVTTESVSRWDIIGCLPTHSKQWALQRIGRLRDARGQNSDDVWRKLLESLQKNGN